MRSSRILATTLLAAAFAFAGAARADDTQPPEITHTPLEKAPKGHPVRIHAKIVDQSKFFPQVFYRWDGKAFEKPLDMKKARGKKTPANTYEASIPIKGESLEYYIEAYDEFGNGPARAGTPEAPFKVQLEAVAVAAAPSKKDEPKVEATPVEQPKVEEPKPEPVAQAEPSKPEPKAEPAPVAPPKHEPAPVVDTRPPRPATGGYAAAGEQRTWTWVVGGAGAGLLLGGVLSGLAFKKADDAYAAHLKDTTATPASLQQQYDANKSLGTTSTILTVSGLMLVGGGVALYFFEPQLFGGARHAENDAKGEEKRVQFAATPVQGGAAAVIAGSF
jgi:hypothetical protein